MTVVSNSAGTTEMPALLSIPPKETDSIQWRGALLKYIDAAYAEDTQKYEQDAAILDKLRNSTVVGQNTASLALLDQLFSYYSQVTFIGTRFPLDVGLKFSWRNTFDSSGKKVSLYNLHFERACTVFCIGSLYSRLGCEESRISTDGIRKSCNYFQNAAGCFKYIERELLNDLRATPPIDMQPKSLRSLQSLMLAQAQECIWQKAVMEHMKHGTIARLAIKVADFYNDVVPDNSLFLPSEWQSYIKIKACYFNAVAQYQKANECISQGRYGEEIGRLRVADSYNRKALDSIASSTRTILRRGGGGGFSMQESFIKDVKLLQEAIERDLIRAEKDNDVIYLETVPEPSQLAPILRSDMVKPIVPADIVDPTHWKKTSDGELNRPLFERLVPFAVHQAASVYADRKEFIVKTEIQVHCEQMSEEYSKLCSQLDLPRALDLVDPDALPATLIACAEEVQHEGGGQALRDMLNNVHQLSVKNVQLVDEGFNALEEENDQDDIFRRQYGNLWSRPPSQQLTSTLLTQGTKYHDTLLAAQKADRIVRAKVGNWGKAIDLLSQPVREIISCLPSIRDDESVQLEQLEELMSRLRKLLQESEEIAVRRKRILDEAQSLADADDIYEALMAKSAQLTNGATTVKIEPEQFTEVFDKELKKYEGLQSRLQECHNEHDRCLSRIREVYEQFSLVVAGNPTAIKRAKAIQNLEQAFAKFKEIRANLVEGIKFYSQYTDTLQQFRDACVDFALARRMEASELARDSPLGKRI